MSKQRFLQQQSIDESIAIDSQDYDEEDRPINLVYMFFNEILNSIQGVPFDQIISAQLLTDDQHYDHVLQANDISWFYRADRRNNGGRTIFTFRFPTFWDPSSYADLLATDNPVFKPSEGTYHRVDGWYECTAHNLIQHVCDSLPISEIHSNECRARLFVNPADERTDIVLNFDHTNRRITLTFERGDPARPYQLWNRM